MSDRRRPGLGIVHLGIGAFFRAFGLPQLEDAMAVEGGDWGVLGVSLRSATVRDALAPRDFAYHALERGPTGDRVRDIHALLGVLVAAEDPGAVVAALADKRVRLVTLTVTEKGYCHIPATGALDPDHPAIRADLADPARPRSVPGLLVAALAARRAAGIAPFTCLSCDNLPGNGQVLARVVGDFAALHDPALAAWIADTVCFPASMVDRIVPATSAADIARVAELTGVEDQGAVAHEPFAQWVIEDRFTPGTRPPLAAAGVQIVPDVTPFEHMKLRCLNGTHSAMAYLGQLAGLETVAQVCDDAAFRGLVQALWREEIVPSLAPPAGVDLGAYTDALMARYRNPQIRHRTAQIAMDGSQKLPQRILQPLAEGLAAGRAVPRLCGVVAAWILYLERIARDGGAADDPLWPRLQAAVLDPDPVAAALALRAVVPDALAADPGFAACVRQAHADISARGPRAWASGLAQP